MKELKIEAKVENLETVMDFVNDQLECFHCPIKIQTQISECLLSVPDASAP